MIIALFYLTKVKLIVIKEKQVTLEGNRNYSDGLWDMPIYKTDIQDANYAPPIINLSIYLAINEEASNCIRTNNKHINRKSEYFKILQEF